ncbi:MAG: hypothetical protein ACTS5R_02310 [Candidatus Hodgkinia cicadicola]
MLKCPPIGAMGEWVHQHSEHELRSPSKRVSSSSADVVPLFHLFQTNNAPPLSGSTSVLKRSGLLSLFHRHLAFTWAWLSGIDVIERSMYVDGTFNVLRSALAKGGIIFTDSQPFQHLLDPNVYKHRVVCITRLLHLRSKTPCGPFNDVLAKIASVLDPSSCVLALGTWQLSTAWAINALRSNLIPAAASVLSPMLPVPSHVWEGWVAAIACSPARPYCIILDPLIGLEVIAVLFDVCYHWEPPSQASALPSPQSAVQSAKPMSIQLNDSSHPTSAPIVLPT